MTAVTLDVRHETDATSVVFLLGMIQTLRFRHRLPSTQVYTGDIDWGDRGSTPDWKLGGRHVSVLARMERGVLAVRDAAHCSVEGER
jgi:hypothetical protein